MTPPTPDDPPPPERRTPFEWSLAALRPADAEVARPSFMFKAGQASRQKEVWFWRCVAGGLGLVIAVGGLAGYGLVQTERARAEQLQAESLQRGQVRAADPSAPPDTHETPPAAAGERLVASTRPPAASPSVVAENASPVEIAAALERRRNILIGGLGLIPDAPPAVTPSTPATPSYPGVYAAPRAGKVPLPQDPEPDDPR